MKKKWSFNNALTWKSYLIWMYAVPAGLLLLMVAGWEAWNKWRFRKLEKEDTEE